MRKLIVTAIAMFLLSVQPVYGANKKVITLSSDNTLSLTDPFNGATVVELMQKATEMDANLKSGYPIYLFMYTPGGGIQAGLELIEFFEGLNRPVHTITLFAASMGWQTVQHLGERYIMKYGVLMSHKARGAFSGEFGGGISQLDSRYQLWLRRITLMDKQTVMRTKGKQTLKSYITAYTPELWLNGQEAVNKGYADAVVTVKCDLSLKDTVVKEKDFGFFSVNAVFSACPMKIYPLKVVANILTNQGKMSLTEFLLNNGKFGRNCRDTDTSSVKSVYSTYSSSKDDEYDVIEQKAELCAKDPTLTLDKINNAIKNVKTYYHRNLRDNIVYSY